jgi:hypothetical protein
VDDARRLSQLEQANLRLETSVQAYQDERSRLEAAYKELRASLPGSLHPLALNRSEENRVDLEEAADPETDRRIQKAQGTRAERPDSSRSSDDRKRLPRDPQNGDGWAPSPPKRSAKPPPEEAPLTWD